MTSLRRQLWVLTAAVACGPTTPDGGAGTTATQTSTSTGDPSPTGSPGPTDTGIADDTGASGSTGENSSDTGSGSTGAVSAGSGSTTGGGDDGGSTDATTSSTSGSSTSDGSTSGSSTSGSTTDEPVGEPAVCPQTSFEQGCAPLDCNKVSCGGLFDKVDELGLVRKTCTPQTCDCDPGFVCFQPFAWGGCAPSTMGCGFQTEDCGGAYCVPETIEPPPFACGGTDQASCEAAGCTFVMAPWIDGDQNCHCGEPTPTCLGFPQPAESVPTVTAHYHAHNPGDVRLFPATWTTPPWPWKPCAGDPDAPVALRLCEGVRRLTGHWRRRARLQAHEQVAVGRARRRPSIGRS